MKVSIITVCLNSEKYIEQTIQSVLNQIYKDIEYIIIDGMSTDNTLNIVEKYKPLFNGRLTVVSEKDSGIYNAMNKGIKRATGELIGIINSDDWYELDAVENVVNNYNNEECVLYGGMVNRKDNEITKIDMSSYKELSNCMFGHPTAFVPKSIYNKFGLYDESYRIAADYDFMLRLFDNNVQFKFINKVIANFREGGLSTTSIEKCKNETLAVKEKHGHNPIPFSINTEVNSQVKFLWDKLINTIRKNNWNKIFIYGCGMHTKKLLRYIPSDIKDKIMGIIDREVDKKNKVFEGYNKLTIEEAQNYADSIIISSFDYEYEIYNRINYLNDKVNIIRIYGADTVQEVNQILNDRIM
ncbi:glycosyltransferase family 2 protein [Inconstantimicrobium mannanitabidum]|uniref:Uncharacterized protein n=1 Tax=Inconstantimicrobium mannanitabidum TaxID=1604901 RepID=A0ACB5R8R0_9CLOT|nr:glycosyltransferase family 2 protein [Clostridium sp. TW13]GKX65532.1 hypothetical protein rsdtw13_07900 [Clostridium sp. TW13]